jgi:hypothetical protein
MKKLAFFPVLFFCYAVLAQSVGIGTTTPNSSSVLDLGPSAKPVVLPRLSTAQMNAVTSPAEGMMLYNTNEHQLYSYMRYHTAVVGHENSRWQPVSTGPRMLAWGIVDSFGTEINGSLAYTVAWDATNRWYRLALGNPHEYYKDIMLLMVTAVGNGSWDQAVSTGELIEAGGRLASIKFVDVSMVAQGCNTLECRRRSGFNFTLYDLRKAPY